MNTEQGLEELTDIYLQIGKISDIIVEIMKLGFFHDVLLKGIP